MKLTRRTFVAGLAMAGSRFAYAFKPKTVVPDLSGEVGITVSSLSGHLSAKPRGEQFSLLELPRFVRDELGMRVIDLNTSVFPSYEAEYLDRVRRAADDAGCVLTNLKMNQKGFDLAHPDSAQRLSALNEYRRSIDAAHRLGLRWVRALPLTRTPDRRLLVSGLRELADYAAERDLQLLIENYGWMQADSASVPALIRDIGRDVAACPDTGNWNNDRLRRAGLTAAFPLAVSCDFKARGISDRGTHDAWELKPCFTTGWDAGFRGPWCLEHANRDRKALLMELCLLRNLLQSWIQERRSLS